MIPIGLRTTLDFVPDAAGLGFDYLELPLSAVAALSDGEFDELRAYLEAADVSVNALWSALPDDLPVTGENVLARRQHAYLSNAFSRARRLGAGIISFDADRQRSAPEGFDFAFARRQLGNFLRIAQGHAAGEALRIAVRNIRPAQSNLINTVSEASLLAALLQLDNVGVLADTVQMALVSERPDAIARAGSSLFHVYTGGALSRKLPAEGDGENYPKLFRILRGMGYRSSVSCICEGSCTPQEASAALRCLRQAAESRH